MRVFCGFTPDSDPRAAIQALKDELDALHTPPRILIVEDDPEDVNMLVELLKSVPLSCDCDYANSGDRALIRTKDTRYDLILLDLSMAPMNGVEFMRELRKTDPQVPVAVLTGLQHSPLIAEAIELGAFLYLRKPPRLADVKRLLAWLKVR